MDVEYPYHISGRGRTATAERESHVRDMIEQVLFTSPGERVNRPTFGCGLAELVFEPNASELAAATRMQVQGALQKWLGDVVHVEDVRVESIESTLRVTVQYVLRRERRRATATFSREV